MSAAEAAPGEHVSVKFEGCRGSAGSLNADNTCADSEYTTGNLGPGWNELDIVPHRLTTDLGTQQSATTTYTLNISADNCEFEAATGFVCADGSSGRPGYDFISAAVKNAAKSDASCSVGSSAQAFITPGIGGTDVTIYRTLTITQNKGTTCVFDWFERLALGSHLYPGSSLHSNLTQDDFSTGGIGARDISIPVKEIQPQSINKTMVATQDTNFLWNVSKSSSPATLNFENTCAGTTGSLSKGVTIQVNWTRTGPTGAGNINVVTKVFATNPAHRVITVNVTDVIKSGSTILDTANSGDVDVPANTSNFLVLTHAFSVPSGTTDLNDVATASYIDKLTGIPVPGTTTATANAIVQPSGVENNANATIKDVEDITGTGLTFSVDSVSLPGGTFTYDHDGNGGTAEVAYTLGTPTANQVTWISPVQSGGGSVSFGKTVYVDQPRSTSGTLSDTASVLASPGGTVLATQSASTTITASLLFNLTIVKNIPDELQGGETVTFTFDITGPGGYSNLNVPIAFSAGQTTKSVTITGLTTAGTYTVHEDPLAGWNTLPDQQRTFTDPSTLEGCTKSVTFNNTHDNAQARVQKLTNPTGAGQEAGWVFTLTGPGIASEQVITTDSNIASPGSDIMTFVTPLVNEGTYTIAETPKANWDLTTVGGTPVARITPNVPAKTCQFTVDFPGDAGQVFTCVFTNVQRGSVTVIKTQNGGIPTNAYTFCLSGGPDGLPATNCLTTNATNAGTLSFGTLKPGTYTLCEKAVPAGTHTTLQDQGGVLDPATGDVCLTFTLNPGEDRVFRIDNQFPQGEQRTIGYWKNWNTCTGGRQEQNAAKTGNHLLDEFLPISLGNYVVDTCEKGVAVLSAPSMKYAENGLAAQLLGAKLNQAAGAAVCTAAANAIAAANQLLIDIGYAGPPSAIVGKSHPLRSQFQTQHALLDQYNNALLC